MCAKTIKRNVGFVCLWCSAKVSPACGTCRNHCPLCLWSRHVDGEVPGDRNCDCLGLMEPISAVKSKKGWTIVHRCVECRAEKRNRALPDDDWEKVVELSQF